MLERMMDTMLSNVKFFPRDVVSGKAKKVGDRFTAFFLNGDHEFEVTEHYGAFFFAKLIEE